MILTVFRSLVKDKAQDPYRSLVPEIVAVAETMPGFLSRKSYTADDGERLSLVAFADEQSQRHWAHNAERLAAKQRRRESFYSEYFVQICHVIRESRYTAP